MASHTAPSLEQLLSCKLGDLRKACKENSLPHSGTKAELAERLHVFHVTAAEKARLLADNEPNEAELLGELEDETPTASNPETSAEATPKTVAATDSNPKTTKASKVNKSVKAGAKRKVTTKPRSAEPQPPATDSVPTVVKSQEEPVSTIQTSPVQPAVTDTSVNENTANNVPKTALGQLSEDEKKELRAKRFASHLTSTDEAMEARKRSRAERFGIPYTPPKSTTSRGSDSLATASLTEEDLSRMEKRAARFGEVLSPALRKALDATKLAKRNERFDESSGSSSKVEGPNEEDKKKRRLERFGANTSTLTNTGDEEERKRRRLERFGTASNVVAASSENQEKLVKRAERFGLIKDEAKLAARALRFGTVG